jgi:hypothetical protein
MFVHIYLRLFIQNQKHCVFVHCVSQGSCSKRDLSWNNSNLLVLITSQFTKDTPGTTISSGLWSFPNILLQKFGISELVTVAFVVLIKDWPRTIQKFRPKDKSAVLKRSCYHLWVWTTKGTKMYVLSLLGFYFQRRRNLISVTIAVKTALHNHKRFVLREL